jgi:hypothetical protein
MPMPRYAVGLKNRFQNGMIEAWHGRGMGMCESNSAAQCKSNGKHTI